MGSPPWRKRLLLGAQIRQYGCRTSSLAPLEPTAGSVLVMFFSGGLHLLAGGVGLLVDDLEVTAQLGDELLAGHRTRAAPEVTGGQHIAHDGLVLGLQRRGLGADQRAVGIHVAELITDRHCCPPTSFRMLG